MYEETKSSIDWKGIFLKVIIAFLVVLIAVKGYTTLKGDNSTKKTTTETISESKSSSTFTENIEKLKAAGEKYFTDNKDKLPKNENSTTMVTLNELIKSGNIDSLSDADGKNCDGESSYVTAMLEGTKTKIKANLVCGGASSYSLVYMGENDSVINETKTSSSSSTSNSTSNNTKSSATANKCNSSSCSTPNVNVNTETNIDQKITLNDTSKNSSNNSSNKNNNKTKYTVSFDSNGSSDTYSSQKVAENDTATNPGSPYRRGYTFKYWKLNGNRYYFNEPVNRNITLVACYVRNDSNYDYDYDYDNDYNRRNRLVEDSYQTFVYTMGWDTKGTDYISIDHTLKVPYEVQEYDPVNVKISSISFSRSMKNQDDMSNYYGNHSNTFFYTKNRWDSNNRSVNSLGYIVSRDVSFSYDRGYKNIDDALSNGFDVNWTADNINKQCRNTISVNGVDNICQYGIIYSIKWTYQYYR